MQVGDAPTGSIQSTRYTPLKKLQAAKKISDLIGKAEGAS